jgi:hypothetical protein
MHIFRRIFLSNFWWQESGRQTGSRNLTGPKTLPTIWGTYMKLVTKYQISAINSYWEKCDEKWAYMFNVYKNQQSRQTGSRNLTGVLSNYWWQRSDIWSQASYRYPISWEAFLDPSDSYFLFADLVGLYTHWTYMYRICTFFVTFFSATIDDRDLIFGHKLHIHCRYPILWEAFLDPSDSYFLFADLVGFYTHWTYMN